MSDGVSRRGKIFHMSGVEYKDLLQTIPVNKGIIGEAILLIGTIPSNTDTVVIGAETYTFKTTPTLAYDVLIGASAAASIANLVAKVNAKTALYILASAVATGMKIQFAQSAAGKAKIGTPISYALSETLTAAADVWNQANLNATGQTNHLYQTDLTVVATAENIATVFTIPTAFTITQLDYRIVTATGLPFPTCTAIAEIVTGGIQVTFDDGATAAVAGQKMIINAKGSALL